jgi:hypothetical protein
VRGLFMHALSELTPPKLSAALSLAEYVLPLNPSRFRARFLGTKILAARASPIQDKPVLSTASTNYIRRYPHAIMATKTIQAAEAALPAAAEAVARSSRPMFKTKFGNKQIFLFVSPIPLP